MALDLAPVPDPAEPASQAPQTTRPRTRRTPKFVLPEHHRDEQDDERAAERIEAFIDGPDTTRRRSATVARERRPIELETRPDWTRAVHHEGARHARYGRSASVVLVDLRGLLENGTADRVAARLADAIQGEARETDRATRVGALSFRILLTDTGGRAAKRFAERLDTAFRTRCAREGIPDGMSLCVEIATPARTASLEDALAEAETRLRARTMGSPAA
jgi:GGDEF domain-containing protein